MNPKELNRIKFFSKQDISSGPHLIKAEKLMDSFDPKEKLTLNDLFEYYNINLYFKNNLFLLRWTDKIKKNYCDIVEVNWNSLKEQLIKIDDLNIEQILEELEYKYKSNLWDLINSLGLYKRLSKEKFAQILQKFPNHINYILQQNGIVNKFDKEIRNFLLTYEKTVELLLSKYEEKQPNRNKPNYLFPKSLSLKDKETVINLYLESDDANLNHIRLIENSKDSNDIKLSAKTRLKAKRKSSELNNKIMENGHTWSIRVQVGLSKDQNEPVLFKHEQGLFEAIYSEKLFDELKDNVSLFNVFKNFFSYTDETSLITLVNKNSELDVMERVFMKSKNAYDTGEIFTRKEFLSTLQLQIFNDYLKRNNNNIENLINSFVDYLNDLISPNKIIFKVRESDSIFLEKIRNLLPEFEFLLKQYETLTEEGIIDLELIQISSTPIRFSQIHSQSKKKYIYSTDNLILQLKYLFFSDQSHLFYTDTYKSKYNNLFDLLTSENVLIDDFENYQKDSINQLIEDGYLKINQNNQIEIGQITLIYIIRELYKNEVLSYWHYPKFVRNEIDKLIENKSFTVEDTLLTVKEKNYFNYYLNKKEFTNGYDLRNQYLHGTNTFSENRHHSDYYLLLKIIILALLKIEDDILINRKNYC